MVIAQTMLNFCVYHYFHDRYLLSHIKWHSIKICLQNSHDGKLECFNLVQIMKIRGWCIMLSLMQISVVEAIVFKTYYVRCLA